MLRSTVSKVMGVGRTTVFRMGFSAVLVLSVAAMVAPAAWAETFTVDNTNDSGTGSLRQALAEANSNGSTDTINFALSPGSDAITLTSGQLEIANDSPDHDLTIRGPGADELAVSGGNASRLFFVHHQAKVAIEGLTARDGLAAGFGGGILNSGILTLTGSSVSGNTAGNNLSSSGGGIYNDSNLTLVNTTVSGNTAALGGGLFNVDFEQGLNHFTVTVKNSTISGNTAREAGGGMFNLGIRNVIENSTVTDNSVPIPDRGAGIYRANNLTPGTGGTDEVRSSIISGNEGTDVDFGGNINTFVSNDHNLIGSGNATGAFNQPGDRTGIADPGLGALQYNGGATLTHLPLESSPAMDQGNAFGAASDQRAAARPYDDPDVVNAAGGDGSDIGAVEVFPLPEISLSGAIVSEGNSGSNTDVLFRVRLSKPAEVKAKVNYATEGDTATSPGDYEATSGVLSFAAGDSAKTLAVPVKADALDEPTENFFLNLSNPGGLLIADAKAAGTIKDDDDSPSLSVGDVTVTEPASGTTNATFTVNLSSQSGKPVSAEYSTSDGTAMAAEGDYSQSSGTVYFKAGMTERTLSVLVKVDTKSETEEDFFLTLSGASAENASVADGEGEATIADSLPAVLRLRTSEGSTTSVRPAANVLAVFSKEMDPNSVNARGFYLQKDGSSETIPAAVSYDATYRRAILDPTSKLTPGTTYTATVRGGSEGIKDLLGKALAADKAWSFTVAPDKLAPSVVRVSPSESDTSVFAAANVLAHFSEAMDPTTLTETTLKLYEKGSTTALTTTVSYDAATKTATLNPNANLQRGATYRAVVGAAARDLAGNRLDQDPSLTGNQQKVWFFTTSP